jgi:3-oxoacyl-[acyl-carrier protein] reductase
MENLKNKVAVVTGASKGIGAGIAKAFADAGAKVVVNYATSKSDADKVVNAIETNGGKAIAVQGDVSKSADVKQLFEKAKSAFGHVDILVNNAGIWEIAPIDAVTEDSFHSQFNTNVLGTILSIQQAIKLFPATGGSIINISSILSVTGVPGTVVSSSSKSAIDSITKTLAKELGSRKIRVNTIAPGGTETDGAHSSGFIKSDIAKHMIASTPLGRIGQPDDIAKAAVFLASDNAGWITGERISVSGGLL